MPKNFSEVFDYYPVKTQRALEIITGLIPWSIILFLFIGSFFVPIAVAYMVLIFNVYWFYRSFQTSLFVIIGHLRLRKNEKTNWPEVLKNYPKAKEIYHLVIIPNVKEPIRTIERNLQSLVDQSLSPKQFIVVLGMEARAKEFDLEKSEILTKKFNTKFRELFVTWHPIIPGETIGKHSNNAFAAKAVKKIIIDKQKLNLDDIIVTTCDADTVFSKHYFSLLTYKFLTCDKPYNRFFQAPFFMNTNVHKLPAFMRLRITMGDAGRLAGLQKPSGRIMNFSTYSLSLKLLDSVGYWDVDVIPEDWHINLKCYFATGGDIDIIPLNIPVYGDAPESTTTWKTIKNTYQAEKRWAWGVSDIPYVIKNFFKHSEIPLLDRINKLALTAEWHTTWSASWFLITIGATLPTILNPAFASTTLGYNLPRMSSLILTTCVVGLFLMTFYGYVLNPHHKNKVLAFFNPLTFVQWALLPILGFFFGALPGLESQTRLLFGKYIEYRVTEKV
ncbi:MAG: glycosyltransferase family 2 protein [bacterium]|nr:glycosyltransferase family 2 protein [bacterium]